MTAANPAALAPLDSDSPDACSLEPRHWNQFVAASPYGDVLQSHQWGLVKTPAWQPLHVCVRNTGTPDATALVLRREIPVVGRAILYVPRGPVLDWTRFDVAQALVEKLRGLARAHRAFLIKIDPAVPAGTPGIDDTLRRLGFRPAPDSGGGFGGTQSRRVMKLDITGSPEMVMARFHPKWRYNIRLAGRKGVQVKSDCTREDLKLFHQIYQVTASRDGFTGRPLSYFERLWDVLVEQDMARLFLAYHEGQVLAGAICFVLPPQCWYVYGASSNQSRNVMPNYAMQWAMIQWARERGCHIYDFRGVHDVKAPPAQSTSDKGETDKANETPEDGLVRFKAGFGAQVTEYVGDWDLPLNPRWYWLWTNARPRVTQTLRKLKA